MRTSKYKVDRNTLPTREPVDKINDGAYPDWYFFTMASDQGVKELFVDRNETEKYRYDKSENEPSQQFDLSYFLPVRSN